jgi:hypothetical protein
VPFSAERAQLLQKSAYFCRTAERAQLSAENGFVDFYINLQFCRNLQKGLWLCSFCRTHPHPHPLLQFYRKALAL